MKLNASREALLKPLQAVIGVVERRQTMPVLSHVLLEASGAELCVSATDMEVELVAKGQVETLEPGEITVPGRKLYDIVKALPAGVQVEISVSGERATVKAGRSRFTLATLKASDFPTIDEIEAQQTLELEAQQLHKLIEKTQFSMAQQDVRYYLNGLLLETEGKTLRAVATDGHRLALAEITLEQESERNEQRIIPRKGVVELSRLLDFDGRIKLVWGESHVRAVMDGLRWTSKLIDGRFPDYTRVIPQDPSHVLEVDRKQLREALQRAAILSNEKYRGVRLELEPGKLVIQANNPDQEEAVETLELEYAGEHMEIGFNVNYLMDALAAVDGDQAHIGVTNADSSCVITPAGRDDTRFVVMPMRL